MSLSIRLTFFERHSDEQRMTNLAVPGAMASLLMN